MNARRLLVVWLAAAVAFACAGSSGAASEQRRAHASFAFGIAGGNIIPFTATISRRGRVIYSRAGERSERPKLTVAAVNRLFALAKAERFYALPAWMDCVALPDIGTQFITIRTTGRTKTVRQHGSCSRRFEKLYDRLSAAIAPR